MLPALPGRMLAGVPAMEKISIHHLLTRKRERQPIPVLTCYDYSMARVMEASGIDVILVGDTYGEVCLGHSSTLPVRMDDMLPVTAAVRRGAPQAFLIGDMPFLSYQVCVEEAMRNAGRFLTEAGCDCVKLEVSRRDLPTVEALSEAGIPVMAHLGLKPQSIRRMGHYKCQGKTAEDAGELIEDARRMESAGAVGLLLEAVAREVAQVITEQSRVPVIGCLSGPHCDGQVLVVHDILGYTTAHRPGSAPRYAQLQEVLTAAFRRYGDEVTQRVYPQEDDGPAMRAGEWSRLREMLKPGPR